MRKVNPFAVAHKTGPACEGCPYRPWSVGFVPTERPEQARFMFIGKFPGRDETLQGRNLVGPSGHLFDDLLRDTPIRRSACVLTNAVKCRPIVWKTHGKCKGGGCRHCRGGMVPHFQGNGDCVNSQPDLAQVRECAKRYLEEDLDLFTGDTIIGMGDAPVIDIVGSRKSITKYRGSIWEHGELMECGRCEGQGKVDRKPRKCRDCKGKGFTHVEAPFEPCRAHKTYKGIIRPTKSNCPRCWEIWQEQHPRCKTCEGVGSTPRPPGTCPVCDGDGQIPKDPNKEFVSLKLKPGQIFYITNNPAMLIQNPAAWETMRDDFSRIPYLHEELRIEALKDYDECPGFEKVHEFLCSPEITLDLETSGLEEDSEILMCGVARAPQEALCVLREHAAFMDLFQHQHIIGQNWFQYDAWLIQHQFGILPPRDVWDTRLAGHLLNPDTPNDLTYLTGRFARPHARGYWKTAQNYAENKALVAMIDVDMTTRVKRGQEQELQASGLLKHFLHETTPTAHVAFDMRRRGLRLDRDLVLQVNETLGRELAAHRAMLPDWSGTRTEGQSAKIITHLYETLRLPERRNRKTQRPTANEKALRELHTLVSTNHPSTAHLDEDEAAAALEFIELIQTLRQKSKTRSFFQPDNVPDSGFVHPQWNPAGTATMRWSVSGPINPMVLPKRADVRRIVIGDEPGWDVITADLSQAEVVGFLWAAEEWAVLGKVLHEGLDAHQIMADMMGVSRKVGKTNTFAYIYGEAPRTTSMRSGIPLDEILEIRKKYDSLFPGVQAFRDAYISQAMALGYVQSPFGPRRMLHVTSRLGRGANQAANAPIQSIPPHVVRRAMIRMARELPSPARLILNVHDEVGVTAPPALREEVLTCMNDILRSPVPELPALPLGMGTGLVFNAEFKVGPNWGDAAEIVFADGRWSVVQ